jgi:methionyl-tRNA formyltransferase
MNVHLYATDVSVFRLLKILPKQEEINVTAIVIPENRLNTIKVNKLVENREDIPVYVHKRSNWSPSELPDADIAISWLYSQIIPPNILETYPYGILNMHGGRIPQYRGGSVLQWAIINGECEIGVTWHTMVEQVDAGPIWFESFVPISNTDNALDLRTLLIEEGIRTFPLALNACLDPEEHGKKPDLTKGKVWLQRKPVDGRIYPGWTQKQVQNMVRALPKPWPLPTINVDGEWCTVKAVSNLPIKNSVPYEVLEGEVIYLVLSDDVISVIKNGNTFD